MKTSKLFLFLLTIAFFSQCKSISEPIGYYFEIHDVYIKPYYCFFYNGRVHSLFGFYSNEEEMDALTDTLLDIFNQKNNIHPFTDANIRIDTLKLTIEYPARFAPKYYFVFTPLGCKFYMYGPERLYGTYEFVPDSAERGLISFAASQLGFDDSIPDFTTFETINSYDVIIEDAFCSLQIKSDVINTDFVTHLYADEVPNTLFFLIHALEAMIYDYCKPSYKTQEKPCENILIDFYAKISQKYYSPLPYDDY